MNETAGGGGDDISVVARSIVGMGEQAGRRTVTRAGLRFRVVRRDGVDQILTMDRRSDRVNVVVTDGVVTDSRVE